MAKYLRSIVHDFTDGEGRPDHRVWTAVRDVPEIWHLQWMYEHYATPMRTEGVVKVNIYFTATDLGREPIAVVGIADVYERFDAPHFQELSPKGRQRYFLERFHGAAMRCAEHFGWETRPLVNAYRRIVDEDFQFSFFWKKPLASPDRRIKAQVFVAVSPQPVHLYLVFFDQNMREQQRTLLSVGTDGPGMVEFALGEIRWLDSRTVKVQNRNGRDYWLCTTDGEVEFHYSRAERGDPHGEYDLGRMYYDGQYVLQDRNRGLELIRAAAQKGFKHAVRFLAQLESSEKLSDRS